MTSGAESVLDVSWDSPPSSADLIREAVSWHFDPSTGSPFWLERAKKFDFDPLTDVTSVADLALFPRLLDELRDVPLESLVPRGYGSIDSLPTPPVVGESGGTTGAPKRVFCLPDVRAQAWDWYHSRLLENGVPTGVNWLGCLPTGPHMAGILAQDTAARFGGIIFNLDIDPRWAKIATGRGLDEVRAYVDHLVDQVDWILQSQHIGVLVISPALLEAVCRRERLADLISENVGTIIWGGTSMDDDTRQLLGTEVFPEAKIFGIFGSTMVFGAMPERPDTPSAEPAVFDPPSPFTIFSVVDPETGENVPYGERGQVITHHLTRNLFLPNNLDRDLAVRHPHRLGLSGDAISGVRPVQEYQNTTVVEGVY